MDCDLKQWKWQQQHQSEEEQTSAKIPRPLLEPPQHSHSALPLFVPEPNTSITSLSAFSGMGCVFSSAQWQELELQALIFKYMIAGAPIPPQLIQHINNTLPPACYLYPPYQQYHHHYQPAMLQSGYWGRNGVDPEPGRCRRTDGKKWRCSKDIVPGHKYCDRHVHRGRNRSRKLVETPTPTAAKGDVKAPNPPVAALPVTAPVGSENHFALSGPRSTNLLQLNQRDLENKTRNGGLLEIQNGKLCGESGAGGQLLRQFFDDCPSANQDANGVGRNVGPATTCLSISTPGDPFSDFSLKLSTGNGGEPEYQDGNGGEELPQLDWGTGWSSHQVSSMGGPLAEALRSSTSNASPTSVLYELRRGATSETSSVSI